MTLFVFEKKNTPRSSHRPSAVHLFNGELGVWDNLEHVCYSTSLQMAKIHLRFVPKCFCSDLSGYTPLFGPQWRKFSLKFACNPEIQTHTYMGICNRAFKKKQMGFICFPYDVSERLKNVPPKMK